MDLFHSSAFSSNVEDLMRQYHVPGLAIGIVQNDQVASTGYGKASIEPPTPCTADTLFDIASCSKSLTAASVGLLVDDNENYPEVKYDAIMSSLLPDDFVMPGVGYTEGVTVVEDILSHRTGMPNHDSSYMSSRAANPDDARTVTRNLRNLPVAVPIRTNETQESFSDFLEKRFFNLLGMQSSSLQPSNARAKGFGDRIATGYYWDKDCSIYHGFQSPDCPEGQGAGSIVTSADDFIKWVKALMNREHPINEKVYQGLVRMRTIVNPNARRLKPFTSPVVYAAGLEVYYYRGYMVVGHDGSISGFESRFFFLPDFKFGAVVLGNSNGSGSIATILTRTLIDEVLKVPETERVHRNRNRTSHNTVKGNLPIYPKEEKKRKRKKKGKMQQTHTSDAKKSQPQEIPLSEYIGMYSNAGYHNLIVQIKDDKLFVDATDRSMVGFTLTFEHISDQTKYTAHLSDNLEGGDDPIDAKFIIEDGKAVKMGLHLEPALKEMIWFERVKDI